MYCWHLSRSFPKLKYCHSALTVSYIESIYLLFCLLSVINGVKTLWNYIQCHKIQGTEFTAFQPSSASATYSTFDTPVLQVRHFKEVERH